MLKIIWGEGGSTEVASGICWNTKRSKLYNELFLCNRCFKNQPLINPAKTKFSLLGTQQLSRRLPKKMSLNFLGKVIKPVTR